MASPPILQVKRGALSNLPGLRAGEPAFTTDSFDFYVGIDSTTANNKFLGSYRYWTKETTTVGSSVKLVEGTNNGTNYIALKAPDTFASSLTYVLPGTQGGNNTVLTNDGSGNLSWGSGSSNATFTGITTFSDTTDSTTYNNGAVQVKGGLGVVKSVNIGGNLGVTGVGTIPTLNGTTVTYTTGNFTNGYINTGIVTTLSGTTATYSIGNLTTGYINTGIVTTLSGTTATYTTGNFTNGYVNTGIVTNISGTNLSYSGIATFSNATDSTSSSTGAVQISGGLGVTKSVNVGGNLYVTGVSTFNGLEVVNNGINVSGFSTIYSLQVLSNLSVGGTFSVDGVFSAHNDANLIGITSFSNSTDSTTYNNGAVILSGGLGVNKSVNIGQNLKVSGIATITTLNVTTDNVTTANITTGYINTGIVTTLSGTTATYTTGNFTNGYVNTGIVTNISGTNLSYSGIATFSSTTDSTSSTTGAVQISGGLGVAKSVNIGGNLNVTGITTFVGSVTGTISTSTRATTVDTTATSTNASFYPTFVSSSASATGATVRVNSNLSYNPSTYTLTVPTVDTSSIKASDGTSAISISNTTGAVGFANSVTVNGDFYVIGTTTQVETSQLKVQDNLIDLGLTQSGGVLVPPASNLGIDLGVLLNWYNASAKKAAVYWKNSTSRITLASDVTEVSGVLTANTYADVEIGSLWLNDTAGQSAVASYLALNGLYTGSPAGRYLQNITVDAGTF